MKTPLCPYCLWSGIESPVMVEIGYCVSCGDKPPALRPVQVTACQVTWHDPATGAALKPGQSRTAPIGNFTLNVEWGARFNPDFATGIGAEVHKQFPSANFWTAADSDGPLTEGWI